MTPILVRPVREQLEHDRLIRFLLARYKRKFDVFANVGDQQQGALRLGTNVYFPDLVLVDAKKLAGIVEVETAESTNNLEAMAQWTHFSHAKVPFHLYVPVLAVDAARRLCDSKQVAVGEIWSYRAVNDQFDLVRVFADTNAANKYPIKNAPKASFFVPEPPAPKVEPPPPPPPPKFEPVAAKGIGKGAGIGKGIIVKSLGKPLIAPAPAKPVAPVAKPLPVVKPAAKPAAPVAKAPVKPIAKPVAKPAAKPAPKPAAKAKPVAKSAKTKPAAKPAAKSKPKAAAKPSVGTKKRK